MLIDTGAPLLSCRVPHRFLEAMLPSWHCGPKSDLSHEAIRLPETMAKPWVMSISPEAGGDSCGSDFVPSTWPSLQWIHLTPVLYQSRKTALMGISSKPFTLQMRIPRLREVTSLMAELGWEPKPLPPPILSFFPYYTCLRSHCPVGRTVSFS